MSQSIQKEELKQIVLELLDDCYRIHHSELVVKVIDAIKQKYGKWVNFEVDDLIDGIDELYRDKLLKRIEYCTPDNQWSKNDGSKHGMADRIKQILFHRDTDIYWDCKLL